MFITPSNLPQVTGLNIVSSNLNHHPQQDNDSLSEDEDNDCIEISFAGQNYAHSSVIDVPKNVGLLSKSFSEYFETKFHLNFCWFLKNYKFKNR